MHEVGGGTALRAGHLQFVLLSQGLPKTHSHTDAAKQLLKLCPDCLSKKHSCRCGACVTRMVPCWPPFAADGPKGDACVCGKGHTNTHTNTRSCACTHPFSQPQQPGHQCL